MTLAQLQALAVSTGFADPETAAAIAMAESGGDPHAQGDPRGPFNDTPNGTSTSFGLWQVHVPAHPEYDPQSLLDPNYNAQAALAISSGGTVWKWWSTFNDQPNGDPPLYLQYMSPIGAFARHLPALKTIGSILMLTYVAHLVIQHGGVRHSVRDLRRALRA